MKNLHKNLSQIFFVYLNIFYAHTEFSWKHKKNIFLENLFFSHFSLFAKGLRFFLFLSFFFDANKKKTL